ncbi:mitochondrial ribosome-associated GTPase 1 isoform X1 [Cuculus canorus]|uniref:mitochondrial ribosome-associated GTPase 1 isoform X1 n=1 Tax=Cuculus canorus TaxID=55661 RepID=UPI0023AB541E|nr:mitochondrial ribosome-associated GTPase 1 isoform X1 [Cuculus canorus]
MVIRPPLSLLFSMQSQFLQPLHQLHCSSLHHFPLQAVLEHLKQQGCLHVVFTDCQRDSSVKKVMGCHCAQPVWSLPAAGGHRALPAPWRGLGAPLWGGDRGCSRAVFTSSLLKATCPLLGPVWCFLLAQHPPSKQLLPARHGAAVKTLCVSLQIIPLVAELVDKSPRYHRAENAAYSIMVIGVPNVGKSSLINSLRRLHLKKGKATAVGGEPGITKAVLTRIQVCEKPLMYLVDTPGVLPPRLGDVETGMKLALCGAIRDHLVGEDIMADYLLYALNKRQQFGYVQRYGLAEACDDIKVLLRHVALAQGRTQKVKVLTGTGNVNVTMLSYPAAAYEFLRDFRAGRLGRVTLD